MHLIKCLESSDSAAPETGNEVESDIGVRHLDRINDGILDYETPGALCDLLRRTYGSLPVCR